MKRPLTRAEEKALLLAVLGSLGAETPPGLLQRLKQHLITIILGLLAAVVVIGTLTEPNFYKFSLAAICFALGVSLAESGRRLSNERSWPALAKVIDRSKVEARLRELDS